MATLLVRDLAPDLLLFNGKITTFVPELPRCSAIACKDGRVVAIGDDAALRAMASSNTEQIDLQGRTVVPGFNDAHNHMLQVGIKFSRLELENCT
ncbi:MAG TPA: amidohydrolase family protein, partial [Roseiflexaceae bacterium]|nr:amidohydrolase family protein [Roseiflexaceae bacterium]